MKALIITAIALISFSSNAQLFELNKDLGDDKVAYQGVIELDSISMEEMMTLAQSWSEKEGIDQTLESSDEEAGSFEYSELYKVIGKKSQLGKAYNYRFSSNLKLEFKENKLRYTFTNFKKKSSPGEPGATLEYYIENYNKKGMSIKSKTKDEARLDEIEIELHEQVSNVIYELKNHFVPSKDDW